MIKLYNQDTLVKSKTIEESRLPTQAEKKENKRTSRWIALAS